MPSKVIDHGKLFIAGLGIEVDEVVLEEAFEKFGKIINATVIRDRESGHSRGFGFIQFEDESSCEPAITAMKDKLLNGNAIHVEQATVGDSGSGSGSGFRGRGRGDWRGRGDYRGRGYGGRGRDYGSRGGYSDRRGRGGYSSRSRGRGYGGSYESEFSNYRYHGYDDEGGSRSYSDSSFGRSRGYGGESSRSGYYNEGSSRLGDYEDARGFDRGRDDYRSYGRSRDDSEMGGDRRRSYSDFSRGRGRSRPFSRDSRDDSYSFRNRRPGDSADGPPYKRMREDSPRRDYAPRGRGGYRSRGYVPRGRSGRY